jgi:hypothetical protein
MEYQRGGVSETTARGNETRGKRGELLLLRKLRVGVWESGTGMKAVLNQSLPYLLFWLSDRLRRALNAAHGRHQIQVKLKSSTPLREAARS